MANIYDFKARLITVLFSLVIIALSSGCSVTPQVDPDIAYEPPKHIITDFVEYTVESPVDNVWDPWEGFNRRSYTFNYYFDKFIYLPIVNTYAFITPDYVEDRISNFVDNIFEFNNFTNNLLQLKFKQTGITLARFIVNSTVGVAGLWDPATGWGMPRQTEDFGQTLGHYGVGNGPYIVLPIFGPSNLRDTTGLAADAAAFNYLGPPEWVDDDDVTLAFNIVAAIDRRHRESFRYFRSGSPFEYDLIRMLYTSKREIEIAR